MKFVYEIVKSVVIYLILVSFLMNLIGNSSFKKYIELFTGMLLILILLSPAVKFLKQKITFDYHYDWNQFSIESKEFEKDLTEMEKEKKHQIIRNYKEEIEAGIQMILKEYSLYADLIDIELEENLTAEHYGEILTLTVNASYTKKQSDQKQRHIVMEPISEITLDTLEEEEEKEVIPDIPSPLELKVKEEIANIFKIPDGRISVLIAE